MKKLIFILIIIQTLSLWATDELPNPKEKDRGWSVGRICFTRGAPAYPKEKSIYGINFGIPVSYNYDYFQKIYGLDIGFIAVESKADGLQMGMMNFSRGSDGMQLSFANIVRNFCGLQVAAANLARNSEVVQIGIVNFARRRGTKSFQIGLLNFNDKGFLPIFPIVNWGF